MPIARPSKSDDKPTPAPPIEAPAEPPAPADGADKPTPPPDVRAAFEKSWERHESAYRYLGR